MTEEFKIKRQVSTSGKYQIPTSMTTFSLPSNATNVGNFALQYAFCGCASLTSVDLSNLTSINGYNALHTAFGGCSNLNYVNLLNLTSIGGEFALSDAFQGCTSLSSLSFPSLNSSSFGSYTNQFNNMLSGVTSCTVHFPSNLQSIIGEWSDVTSGFGGTDTTVLFDLPATT